MGGEIPAERWLSGTSEIAAGQRGAEMASRPLRVELLRLLSDGHLAAPSVGGTKGARGGRIPFEAWDAIKPACP